MIEAYEASMPIAGTTCHNRHVTFKAAIFNPPASVTPAHQEGCSPSGLPHAHCPHSQKHDYMSALNNSSGKSKNLGWLFAGGTAFAFKINRYDNVVVKAHLSGLELGFVTLESGALPACPFPAGTIIICRSTRAVYLFVHCAHLELSMSFHYIYNNMQIRRVYVKTTTSGCLLTPMRVASSASSQSVHIFGGSHAYSELFWTIFLANELLTKWLIKMFQNEALFGVSCILHIKRVKEIYA